MSLINIHLCKLNYRSQEDIPALSHYSSDEFARYLADKITVENQTPVIAFFEEQVRNLILYKERL